MTAWNSSFALVIDILSGLLDGEVAALLFIWLSFCSASGHGVKQELKERRFKVEGLSTCLYSGRMIC